MYDDDDDAKKRISNRNAKIFEINCHNIYNIALASVQKTIIKCDDFKWIIEVSFLFRSYYLFKFQSIFWVLAAVFDKMLIFFWTINTIEYILFS